ncbi:Glucose/arabinose dehydrogenase, beta-propeller fold [Paenibacillus sp. UNCCL117]|uniref:PQQ-dependent sugar dehydrogenase n=1 Tax=unclassified Paenibacillus TaxID=185978 RepID=UPI00088F5238|nr:MULTISPECIES: PQQ-dependent sugar dehydrogenase [unclassified Paenibacillus]SDC05020.1 Glucose/arabinose dehydrogenase, beta-propeller fold [Paenibacillus sp. cl123]SFW37471.1 Glucose/arabinose dehydrogenase, beta-propeller fold [Paenibacillus sp. UNCCL117]
MLKSASLLVALAMAGTTLAGCWEPKAPTAGSAPGDVRQEKTEEQGSPELMLETAAEKLKTPWAIDFHGDVIYISERGGSMVKLADGVVQRQKVQLAKPVHQEGEGGFMGFVLTADYADTGQAYAYHTYKEGGQTLNRVVLLKEDGDSWREVKPLLERIPGSRFHNGGRLAIGPDKQLYITTGDAQEESVAQQKDSLAGKILRMTPQGDIPPDNPTPGSYVYSYGHRNPQGIAWSGDGSLYSSEHGPSGAPGGHDEINRIKPAANYGWPLIIGNERKEGMELPLYHSGERAIAPSGIAADGTGGFLVATLVGETLYRFNPQDNRMTVVLQEQGRLRDVKVKDGYAYVITNNTDGRGQAGASDDRLLRFKLR